MCISRLQAVFTHGGESFEVHSLQSEAEAAAVCDLLTREPSVARLKCCVLLEALLTVPFGQIIGIQDVEHGDPFLYRAGSDAQRNFSIIGECFQGAHKFAIDNIDLLGSPEPLIEDFVQFFESYHAAIVSDADAFKPIFALDDSFFGTDINNAGLKL